MHTHAHGWRYYRLKDINKIYIILAGGILNNALRMSIQLTK